MLGRARVTYDELSTITTEVECIINDRPLTYTSSDLQDEPITPSQLIYGRRLTTLPWPQDANHPEVCNNASIKDCMNKLTILLEQFWSRWKAEYLPSLREHHTALRRKKHEESIKTGDVVVVHDDTSRIKWKLAKVTHLLRGNDGIVRSTKIKTQHGSTDRPINKL